LGASKTIIRTLTSYSFSRQLLPLRPVSMLPKPKDTLTSDFKVEMSAGLATAMGSMARRLTISATSFVTVIRLRHAALRL
jgi:hypothetical protein